MATSVEVTRPLIEQRRALPSGVRRRRFLAGVAEHSVVIALAIMFLAPFVFMVLTGLMTDEQALTPQLWPDPFQLSNFGDVFDAAPLLRYAGNTFLYATLATVGMLVSSVPVAYA